MEITAAMVKELRSQSGAGIMECKSALKETSGDVEAAITFLRKKGLAKADKKSDRQTGDGSVGTYIHAGNKLGVMVALNCETDFVANTPDFQELVRDIAMHIAAAKPRFATRDEVTQEILDKKKKLLHIWQKNLVNQITSLKKLLLEKWKSFTKKTVFSNNPLLRTPTLLLEN